ncbi:protein kinase-like domain, Concanavalin A-like lectin/glucanase domain protein [Artemisia annua]|uniref:Protein kinase-like domain, Concanavalin A-like lectin/glucanase domain protein n=1 Tax=Artemisia annua TaxID=35608 RepID=A0A2U1MDT5_ARTAN|nr:protein kinase-like domain, Concanavalin A-like lectin/glucanase domain protein [Artemisia annua]
MKHSVDRMNQTLLSEAIGTIGYIDPAIEKTGGVTHKSDVYSFGVVLFELLCGRRAFIPNEDNTFLAQLAKSHYENGTLQEIIHPDLWNQMNPKSFQYFSRIAYSCLEVERPQRPDIQQVYTELIIAYGSQCSYEQSDLLSNDKKNEADPTTQRLGDAAESVSSNHSKVQNLEHLRIGLKDIHMATQNFSDTCKIGDSKFGTLYKAELKCFDREYLSYVEGKTFGSEYPKRQYTVTIERIDYDVEDVFHNKIDILRSCKHQNIHILLGFCDEAPHMLLVYEYVQITHLSRYLEMGILTWEKCLKICLDVARGLNYLHTNMEDQKMVIYSGITSYAILLDDNLGAKIFEFGSSVFLHRYQDDVAPKLNINTDRELDESGKPRRESDLYMFGVIMLEVLCGRSAFNIGYDDGTKDERRALRRNHRWNGEWLAPLARRWFNEGIIKDKVARTIKDENWECRLFLNKGPNENSLEIFIKVARQCFAETHNQRPTMEVVITELEKALSFQENHKDPLRMSFEDIKFATQDFSHENDIGGGGFGRVFKGRLPHVHGKGNYTIVAKRLDTSLGQGDQQFYSELQILCEYKHKNVINLLGYSNDTRERIIVYEHASRGSLDKYLNDVALTWRKRLQICIDVATGLAFLHGSGQERNVVIHRDIKTANILLFDDWKAKVADFGLSLISTINEETNYVIDHVCGTQGYCDPLYIKSGFLTIESDIYSFGVVLFEILFGRSTYTIYSQKKRFLHSLVKDYFEEGKEDELVFEAIKEQIVPKSLSIFQNIAYQCLHDDRELRPTSKEVLAHLKMALEFQVSFHSITEVVLIPINCFRYSVSKMSNASKEIN